MSNSALLFNKSDTGIATLTLNRPDIHNAFDDLLIQAFRDHLNQISHDDSIRLVELRAHGKSFCAGADLDWMKRMAIYTEAQNKADAMALAEMLRQLNDLPKPTLGIIQGPAFGGGVGLVACCDLVVASEEATFCLSEVKLGLIPAVISPYVIQAISARQARRYFLTAEIFSAIEAQKMGLVHEVAPPSELETKADFWKKLIQKVGPQAVGHAKELISNVENRPITEQVLEETAEQIARIRVSPEGQEGLSAFLEKRKPNWIQ